MRVLALLLTVGVVISACSSSPADQAQSDGAIAFDEVGDDSLGGRELVSPGDLDADAGSEALADQASQDDENAGNGAATTRDDTSPTESGDDSATTDSSSVDDVDIVDAAPAGGDQGDEPTLDQLVAELIEFVEAERGLRFEQRPNVRALDTEEFAQAWVDVVSRDATENQADFSNYTAIYHALGVIDDGSSLEEIWTRFGDAGVIGYYDLDTKEIVLRGDEITALTETVLVHELVHALEDQVFGLDRAEFDGRTDEIDWTFSALQEGSARVIEARYRATFTRDEIDEEAAVQAALPRSVSLNDFTTSFLELQFGRYRYGEDFANALWATGQDRLDDALETPPQTSEEVVNPELFNSSGSDATSITPPVADGDVFMEGTWGQAGFAALFADVYDREEALQLSQGWGGDRFVAWRQGERSCVRIHVAADTPDDLDRYADALEDWANQGDRQIFFPTADLVRVTSCG